MKRSQKMALGFGLGASLLGLSVAELAIRGQEGLVLRLGPWSLELDQGPETSARSEPVFEPPGMKYALRVRAPEDLERGWHENQPVPEKKPGERVILCVGDSLTYGVGVGPSQSWPARLATTLPANVKVYNFGVPGYDAEQVASLVTSRLAPYQPDLLIWGTYTNDNMPTYVHATINTHLPIFVGSSVPPSVQILPDPIALPLLHHFALFRLLQGSYFSRHVDSREAAEPYAGWYERYMDQILLWGQTHNVPIAVLAIAPHILADPAHCGQVERTPGFCRSNTEFYHRVQKDLEERGIPWADGLAAYQHSGKQSFYPNGPQDQDHPNAEGQQLLTDAVVPVVQKLMP